MFENGDENEDRKWTVVPFQRVLREVGFCLKILCYLQNEKIWVVVQN